MAKAVIPAVEDDLRADRRCLQSGRHIAVREITVDPKPAETCFVYEE